MDHCRIVCRISKVTVTELTVMPGKGELLFFAPFVIFCILSGNVGYFILSLSPFSSFK